MAPGCFSMTSSSTSTSSSTNNNNNNLNYELTTQSDQSFIEAETTNSTDLKYSNNDIPLPSTPPPPRYFELNTASVSPIDMSIKSSSYLQTTQLLSVDTVDSFEILEQTIMKQKRLAKMKNNDLRLKTLLKQTFNLVCAIMDHENGIDDDDEEDLTLEKSEQQNLNECEKNEQFLRTNVNHNEEKKSNNSGNCSSNLSHIQLESVQFECLIETERLSNENKENTLINNKENLIEKNHKNKDGYQQNEEEEEEDDENVLGNSSDVIELNCLDSDLLNDSLNMFQSYAQFSSINLIDYTKRIENNQDDNKNFLKKRRLSSNEYDENDEEEEEEEFNNRTSNCFSFNKNSQTASNAIDCASKRNSNETCAPKRIKISRDINIVT